jgi:hypothetical protein
MKAAVIVSKLGSYSLPLQCVLLCIALPAISFKLGAAAGWLFVASLLAGLTAFASGIAASIVLRSARWLVLSAAAVFVVLFSLLVGMSLGGGPGL